LPTPYALPPYSRAVPGLGVKFRNKIGLHVALEALKEGLGQGCKPEDLMEFARIDRVEKIMLPYLEALLSENPTLKICRLRFGVL